MSFAAILKLYKWEKKIVGYLSYNLSRTEVGSSNWLVKTILE